MLLIHQAGTVKIGEVIRYTLTYTPSNDRILPTPTHLHIKIKNTSAIPLRAAWVHGPYALHVSAYSSTFNPHQKVEDVKRDGAPDYEPMLKAGGTWNSRLVIPEHIRETGADLGKNRSRRSTDSQRKEGRPSVTWIIEIASQILFSTSASVGYEVLVGRDERSLELGFAAVASHGHGGPGQIDHSHSSTHRKHARTTSSVQRAGVYSKAVELIAEDTETLWDKPALPTWEDFADKEDASKYDHETKGDVEKVDHADRKRARKKVHLVVLTHGLHSNLGADMLFLKESIDATVRQARIDARERRKKRRASSSSDATKQGSKGSTKPGDGSDVPGDSATAPLSGGQEEIEHDPEDSEEDEDEEQTIVRGFSGNAAKTENGIQYLGKRLAKHILRFTYPDQPFLPVKKSFTRQLSDTFKSDADKAQRDGQPSHHGSSIHHGHQAKEMPYEFTSISFIGHSLGGLVQTYAIAYIQKHSPTFFEKIKPVNFICMASPMLGLSNENPMYVKFALDFGLVGRTGQDLGLTWRPPTIARGGWNAVIGGLGVGQKDKDDHQRQHDPAAKPLLRILPTGPAHKVLRMFRNRTLYSNVVNDGIVPLRTSCLLFLDWRGLGKVEKARRENGLLGTVAEWGWAELTGANSSTAASKDAINSDEIAPDANDDDDVHVRHGEGETVPQPDENETSLDQNVSGSPVADRKLANGSRTPQDTEDSEQKPDRTPDKGIFGAMLDFFRPTPKDGTKPSAQIPAKTAKALRRAQTVYHEDGESNDAKVEEHGETTNNPTMRPRLSRILSGHKRPMASRGDSLMNAGDGQISAPPKTSIFESAGDVLHPPLPSRHWITDPSSRARTIFHDRVYHPEDIPPPPIKRGSSRSLQTLTQNSSPSGNASSTPDTSSMKVEEKIARAYHRDLSWRKVLVRLEPDAHNNMIVRRMFANAYGWPVIKHLCDTHFADTFSARTRDENEPAHERARPIGKPVPETGEEVKHQTCSHPPPRSQSEMREARDELTDLGSSRDGMSGSHSLSGRTLSRRESEVWDDAVFEGSENDDSDVDDRNIVARFLNPHVSVPQKYPHSSRDEQAETGAALSPTTSITDGHRGISSSASSVKMPGSPGIPRTASSVIKAMRQPASPVFDSADIDPPIMSNVLVSEPRPLEGSRGSLASHKDVIDATKDVE